MHRPHLTARLIGLAAAPLLSGRASAASPLVLRYDAPAFSVFNPAIPKARSHGPAIRPLDVCLPIGNGRLGALLSGDPGRDRLTLSEDSLWTGGEGFNNGRGYGAYQFLGDLYVTLPGHEAATGYHQALDIGDAVDRVDYTAAGVGYHREYLASHPAGVIAVRYTADRPGAYTGRLNMVDPRRAEQKAAFSGTNTAAGNRLTVRGTLSNKLAYETQVVVTVDGGTVRPAADGDGLEFAGCNAVTVVLSAGTNYAMDAAAHYRGADPHAAVTAAVDAAAKQPWDALRAAHERDYHALFDRVHLDLGRSSAEQTAMPIDRRKLAAAKAFDPELEALLFQFGRYVLISSSRPGGLPANLQGVWNDTDSPDWNGDYHTNINIQMNYWPAEVANLSECQLPLFDLIESQIPAWRRQTVNARVKVGSNGRHDEFEDRDWHTNAGQPATRGFAVRTGHNTTGGETWVWDPTATAWYGQHFWQHYAFTHDRAFLQRVAYPYLKEMCQFWEDHLHTLPDGQLVVPAAQSPEHGPVADGISYAQEIVWDLFGNYLDAADALGVDPEYRATVARLRQHLAVPGIGSWGQLLEWHTELKDRVLDTPDDHHRHASHLFAVYPGHQIDPVTTPDLARAAAVSLKARGVGGDATEWSFAWRTAMYARLGDAANAHSMFQRMFDEHDTCPNLFGLHFPHADAMQADGTLGITAAVAEMLLQSQNGEVVLLPALPEQWRAGTVRGLRARGAFTVDETWADGKLVRATIRADAAGPCRVRYGQRTRTLSLTAGGVVQIGPDLAAVGR